MGTLKDNIQHEVHIFEPKSLENAFNLERKNERRIMALEGGHETKNIATRRVSTNTYREGNVSPPKSTQAKPTRLIPQQVEEREEKGLCFNCDNKYNKGHKCSEKKLFYMDYEEEDYPNMGQPHEVYIEDTTPITYFHESTGTSTPGTLKI